jgi:hypothetical protein
MLTGTMPSTIMKHKELKWIPAALTLLSLSGCQHLPVEMQPTGTQRFSFALIGDVPYGVAPATPYPPFEQLIEAINQHDELQWVIHTGDIKSGSEVCNDAMLHDRLTRFNAFNKPFIYTPGDNEWTDCHRVKAGEYQPLERLRRLREIFFAEPGLSIGNSPMRVDSQAFIPGYETFPENVMWSKQDVVFAAVHVVGSHNGLAEFDPNSSVVRTREDDAEVARRIDAAIDWINRTFDYAIEQQSPGVLILMQANPGLEASYALPQGKDLSVARKGYSEILQILEQRTLAFEKPVVLAHGDTHHFRVDKPALVKEEFIPNFTRVENFGASPVHWIEVSVDPNSAKVFSFHPMVIEGIR